MTLTNCYITLEQFKDHMSLDESVDNDAAAERAISAACRAIDERCARVFYADASPTAHTYRVRNPYRIHIDDVSTLTGLVVKTDEGNNGTYDTTWTLTTDYVIKQDRGARTGSPYTTLCAVGGRCFPTYGLRDRLQVTATHGWTTPPDEVVEAALLKAARLFRRKDSPEGVAGGFEFGAVRISKYEDPDICLLLDDLTRQDAILA